MTMLRIPLVSLLMGVALVVLCSPLNAQVTPPASETRTGCLTSGSRTGTFLLVEDLTGQQLTIVSPSLATLKLDQLRLSMFPVRSASPRKL